MKDSKFKLQAAVTIGVLLISGAFALTRSSPIRAESAKHNAVVENAVLKVQQGEQIFRFDTFGDESFWGSTIQLHRAIEGANFGGVGPGVSPKTALAVGLKVDVDQLPPSLVEQIKMGQVNLNDPAVTLALLKLNAVVGVTGHFNPSGNLS